MNNRIKADDIDKYTVRIVIEKKELQNECSPPMYKSELISKGFINFGLPVISATSLYNPRNFLSWVK
jgi:hypothetical protein